MGSEMCIRDRAEREYKLHGTEAARKERNQAANKLKQIVKKAIIDFERKISTDADEKQFWKYSRSKLRPHITVGPLCNPHSGDVTDDPEKCVQIFADHYSSLSSIESNQAPTTDSTNSDFPFKFGLLAGTCPKATET